MVPIPAVMVVILASAKTITRVTPISVMVTSAAVITLAVPTAVMASTDRSTAVRAHNVLFLLLIYYAHREEHLADGTL